MFKTSLLALTLVVGTLGASAVTTTQAQAGPRTSFSVEFGHGWNNRRFDRPRRYRHARARCRPVRALRKARRMGVRGAYVHRIGRRGVVIAGHRYGRAVRVGFSRARHCPVRFARRVGGGRI